MLPLLFCLWLQCTGYDQADIEGAIRQCAPATRQKDEGCDWNDYAQRTARYAYSAAGERQTAELGKYRQQWEKLKGRELQQLQLQAKTNERNKLPSHETLAFVFHLSYN